jgi:hypothetical protein
MLLTPPLQHHQRKQRVRVILATRDVRLNEARHFRLVEQAAPRDPIG